MESDAAVSSWLIESSSSLRDDARSTMLSRNRDQIGQGRAVDAVDCASIVIRRSERS